MKRVLRSYIEPGSPREAIRRAQWTALGISDEDMLKPKIAVVNSSSELAICFSHLDGIAKMVKESIRAAGGLPFEVRTAAPSDFIIGAGAGGGYILASRDLIVNDMEIAIEGARLDGMICLSSCDKTPPAHLMAAGRFNIPSILVICGYQPSGRYAGKHVDIEDLFLGTIQASLGKLTRETLKGMSENAIKGPGVCAGMATANSMHVACEALGMALPGSAPVLANSPRMLAAARSSGERIVAMVNEDLKPRQILTAGAFRNAVAAVLAVSGSINCIKHLQATAVEAGVDVDVFRLFNDLGESVPVLSAVRPNGENTIEEFEAAGGARALLKQLEPLLDTSVLTVTGQTLAQNLRDVEVANPEVIRPIGRSFSDKAPIVILHGSLAPESAVVKLGLRGLDRKAYFSGPAVVYDSGADAMRAIEQGQIQRGSVLVVRGMGPKGGPGMAGPASSVVFALDSAGLQSDVAFVSDGQLSGLCNKGLTVAEVSPEAAVGGPLSLVQNGDQIVIDVDARTLDLLVGEEELAQRRARLGAPVLPASSGYLSIYQRTVQPMSTGAVLIKRP
ncbi:MAG TPA: dihydroxy-acid dehydratase [Steroidobacteraceae bacterium]|jgi:dihydroxy-acid dehydratase|nr:dihydroxy-acid dehydratase [Steroidobacteraceae bacterium]